MMTIKVIPNEKGNTPGKLADVELHFGDNDGIAGPCECPEPLDGLKLIGFSVWEGRGGRSRTVTFPARQYSINGERRSFALLRPLADTAAQDRLRNLIVDAYNAFEDGREPTGPAPTQRRLDTGA